MNKKVDFPGSSYPVSSSIIDCVDQFNQQELSWLSGYCAGLAKGKSLNGEYASSIDFNSPIQTQSRASVATSIQVLFGSQTGNSKKIAESLFASINKKGLDIQVSNIGDFKPKDLANKQILLFVISTQGEGEPPDDAIEFFELLSSKRAPKLDECQHAVLGLGDSSYEFFCQTGKDLEQILVRLGSKILLERVDCDLDFDHQVEQWINDISGKLTSLDTIGESSKSLIEQRSTVVEEQVEYSKSNPFSAAILSNQKITGRGSDKLVHHLELSIEGSGINYLPGDGVGIWAKNDDETVLELLKLLSLNGESKVRVKNQEYLVKDALADRLEISLINRDFVERYANNVAIVDPKKASQLLERINNDYSTYISNHQIVDIVALAPLKLNAQEFVDLLKPIKPRIYSISSSPISTSDEIHITVKLQETESEKRSRKGTASRFLIEELVEEDEVLIFIERNNRFRLPAPETDILMVGPGTGIAPFRSFLHEREEQDASGKNWLFFGNSHFNTEFLYQLELQQFLNRGLLDKLSVAFSRDQHEKIYVQHRMLENAAEVWDWIDKNKASFYVCGDMNYMAKDVEGALLQIFQSEGGYGEEQAKLYLKGLKKEGRYLRDVY